MNLSVVKNALNSVILLSVGAFGAFLWADSQTPFHILFIVHGGQVASSVMIASIAFSLILIIGEFVAKRVKSHA